MWNCYLLRSASVPGKAYIGASPDVAERLRSHNGEKAGGALRTRAHRPWELVVTVSGFRSKTDALAFEFAWHFPGKIGSAPGMNHIPLVKAMKAEYAALRLAVKGQARGRADAVAWALQSLELMKVIGKWRDLSLKWQPVTGSPASTAAVLPARPGGTAVAPASQVRAAHAALHKEQCAGRAGDAPSGESEVIVVM